MAELDAIREANKLQEKIAESELQSVQELLGRTKKEKDEALKQVKKLKHSIAELWNTCGESLSQGTLSNAKCPFSSMIRSGLHPHSSGSRCLDPSFGYPEPVHMDIFSEVNQSWVDSAPTEQLSLDMDILDEEDVSFVEEHESLNMGSLNAANDQHFCKPNTNVESTHLQRQSSIISTSSWENNLQRQSSNVSTASGGHCPQRQSSTVSTAASRFHSYLDNEKQADNVATYLPLPNVFSTHQTPKPTEIKACVKRACTPSKHVMESPSTPNPRTEKPLMLSFTPPSTSPMVVSSPNSSSLSGITMLSRHSTKRVHHSSNSLLPKKRHLSEPVEADIVEDSLVTSLPEKGKLLEAVAKAGPLLKQLLVIGTLPEWNNPPPMIDIPMVPIASNMSSFPLVDIHNDVSLYTKSSLSHTLQSNMHMVHS